MGITDGKKASSSAKDNAVIAPKAVNGTETNGHHETLIPQMFITSAEGESEELTLDNDASPNEVVAQQVKDDVNIVKDQPETFQPLVTSSPEVTAPQTPVDSEKIESSKPPSPPPPPPLQNTVQRPLVIDSHEVTAPQTAVDSEKIESCKPPSPPPFQNTAQRPLVIECSGESQTQLQEKRDIISTENGELPEANKPTQSTVQRPLIVDAETAKKQEGTVRAESIYEVIEPSDGVLEEDAEVPGESGKEIFKGDQEQHKAAKESDGFFAKSKAFWKHDAKPFFSLPKFSFHSKEPKEIKKEEEKVTAQEYSLEAAEASQKSFGATEHYRKLGEDVLPQDQGVSAKEENLPQEKKSKTSDRSSMIHPPDKTESTTLPAKHKAEVDDFDLHEDKQVSPKSGGGKRASTPETLYDTCCIKLAILLRNKAFEIAADSTKPSPPKKPPKPTAEALAKARSEIATKKLKEYESKPHNFGDNIPVGIDGIRYADEDTESSTDYKDLENFGVIFNPECYGIIRKLKMENNTSAFSAPSTCSGVTSYYSAETGTLKDGYTSDNTLETISLGSYEDAPCPPSVPNSSKNLSDQSPISLPCTLVKPSSKSTSKKVPPPIPPKPTVLLKHDKSAAETVLPSPEKSSKKDVARCVNSLSLSPRPILRSASNAEGIKKRPLTIAGVKATEFEQFSSKKIENAEKKPVLTTVVTNKSLKTMRNLPLEPASFTKSLSFSPEPSSSEKVTITQAAKPPPPPRPPPPVKPVSVHSVSQASPLLQDKGSLPAMDVVPPPRKALLRHHVSPPRPLPPATKPSVTLPPTAVVAHTKSVPPPRPPPPTTRIHTSDSIVTVDTSSLVCVPEKDNLEESKILSIQNTNVDQNVSDLSKSEKNSQELVIEAPSDSVSSKVDDACGDTLPSKSISESELSPSSAIDLTSKVGIEESPSVEVESVPVDSADVKLCVLNQELSNENVLQHVEAPVTAPARRLKQPRPPPRIRRIRSRTVEVVSLQDKVPTIRRRSQSLSDIETDKFSIQDTEIEKKPLQSNLLKAEDHELKLLYTTVNKNSSRMKSDFRNSESDIDKLSTSSDTMSSRPLPPPPLPPRSKSHSTSRRSKSDERPSVMGTMPVHENSISKSESMPSEISGGSLKPPARKKKDDKIRFFSLRSRKREILYPDEKKKFSNLKSSIETSSLPIKPERKIKHHQPIQFDENANIASPLSVPFSSSSNAFHLPCPETVSKAPARPRVRSMGCESTASEGSEMKGKSPALQRSKSESKKSHSSWYDDEADVHKDVNKIDSPVADSSWEVLDMPPDDDVTDIKFGKQTSTSVKTKKPRQTSTFYVDVESQDASCSDVPSTPLKEDKETSPLPLYCSEKSVQTSLETLSAGIASRSEVSDDTDELLDLAQTLQDELKTIIKRHKSGDALKSSDESCSTSEPSSVVGRSSTKKKTPICAPKPRPPLESTTSSASEIWQISSSEESEDDSAIQDASNLSEISRNKKKRKIFYIAQEIMSSEEAFVDSLKLLNVDFRAFIDNVNKQRGTPIVPDEILNQILNHLPQLQHLNENLLMELKYRIEHWDTVNKIADVIVKMGPFLKLYSWYIQDFEATTSVLEEARRKYPPFGQAIKEYEASPRCKRLTLNHYMLKPVQRIPQYRLLLQEYLHQLPDGSEDYDDTVEALRIVSDVANHANESMRHGDNFQKLISIQSSIIGHKEIIKPGRMFIKEGELMKLSRKGMQPRWFVLMNDLLLYLTPVQQGLYRINHELTLAGMKVAIPLQQDFQNEFSIISVTRSFTLNARSPEERQEWIVALTKAIEENASKRSTFTAGRLQQKSLPVKICTSSIKHSEQSSEDVHDQGFVLGKTAPVWIPDARVTMCQLCTSEFTVTFRRHHCRACGKVVCSICSSNRISLQYLGNRIARVCDECYTKLGQGSSANTESGETDSDNQQIAVKPHLRTDHRHQKKPKRQLPSVLKEVCANDVGSTISGYIHKRSNNSWKKNWFVIKDKVLYEFRASEDVAALRSIPLLGFQINTFSEPFEGIDQSLLFEISHPGQAPILFHAETPGSAQRWIKELKDATILE